MKETFYKTFSLSKKLKQIAPLLFLAALSSCTKPEVADNAIQEEKNTDEPQITTLTDRYMVVMKSDKSQLTASDASYTEIQQMLQDNHLSWINLSESDKFLGSGNAFVATLKPQEVTALKSMDGVEMIEPDQVILLESKKQVNRNNKFTPPPTPPTITPTTTTPTTTTTTTSTTVCTDTRVNNEIVPWGVTRMGTQGSSGTGKTAWIIDSGIDFNHPDLNVDKLRSKSFLSSIDGGLYNSPTDELGHGTAVAGIVGAKANGAGIVGVAPGTSLISLKVVNKAGSCLVSNIVNALNWVYTYGKPGDVVNLSLQANASTILDDAVKRVASRGIFVTIGAGNSAADCSLKSPQRVNATNIFTVSAMNSDNTFWTGSNYGLPVDFTAPGTRIYTTQIGSTYNYSSGTSFSAPHLAGLLLINSGLARIDGYVRNDPDTKADGIAHK